MLGNYNQFSISLCNCNCNTHTHCFFILGVQGKLQRILDSCVLRRRRINSRSREGGGVMVGPARPLFVLFGSSIVQLSFSNGGWGAILSDIYARKVDIILRGYYGWNSRRAVQTLDQVFPKDAAVQPSLVIVYFGGNDSMGPHPSGLGPHVPLPEYIENMRKIAIHLKNLSDKTRIIFLSCPPVNEAKVRENQSPYLSELVRTNELCRIYSDALIELCQEMDVKVVDLWTAIQKREDWSNTCFTDGIHLSAEGSKVVVEEILKVLKQAEWEPSLHWKSMPTEFPEDSPYDLVASDGKTTINPSEWTFHREIQWD
ncbi:GDSL esterase/lipase CPRD49 [Sesamum alatum]|uniref:GDSL esterase/lipase CPRD49 n=1 Tax=Sesamum alatum TaxID=300844 RepID=A0AAE2CVX8_9LAMI|nr:GDSL esterase/lipase CPRD49 [Sesamum alatum]